jgi:C4-dicarboxylate-specific signal transduction histidine kinase
MENRKKGQQSPVELRRALEERVKELNCLYGISRIVERGGGSVHTILQEVVNLLPSSWEHPEICCARIVLDGMEFETDNYSNTRWKQVAQLRVHGEPAGMVEVRYLEEKPTRAEGPFLAEERALLNEVAERISHLVERLRGEQLLLEREAELRGRLTHLTRVSTLGEMASSIAHEVNQPLTAIATYTQACKRMLKAGTTDTDETLEILTRVTDEAIRAGGIIHRLNNLVRRQDSKRIECDVNELIRDLEHLASVDTRLHNVRLDLQLADRLPLVHADGIQIQQVVLNLIRNGVDAMADCDAENRRIVVGTALRDDGKVEISVADTGCGLPPDSEEELFQPFFTTKKDGMGMGLSVSKTIVTSHGGQMWFSRNQNRGTTFFVTIPAVTEEDDG